MTAPDDLERLRLGFRQAFAEYQTEIGRTESAIAEMATPPTTNELRRLMIQQAAERAVFHRYQEARESYVQRALYLMATLAP